MENIIHKLTKFNVLFLYCLGAAKERKQNQNKIFFKQKQDLFVFVVKTVLVGNYGVSQT